jgi:hypothetical protein
MASYQRIQSKSTSQMASTSTSLSSCRDDRRRLPGRGRPRIALLACIAAAIGLFVAEGPARADRAMPSAGGVGAGDVGAPITIRCPRGAYLAGLNARAGDRLDHIQPLCVWAIEGRLWTGNPFPAPGNGMGTSQGGSQNNVICPRDHFVQRIDVHSAGESPAPVDIFLTRLSLVCGHDPGHAAQRVDMQGFSQIPAGFTSGVVDAIGCWISGNLGDHLAVGVYGQANETVNRLGLVCDLFKGRSLGLEATADAVPRLVLKQPALANAYGTVAAPRTVDESYLGSTAAPAGEGSPATVHEMVKLRGAEVVALAPAAGQRFDAPSGPNGLRLYACPTVGGEDACASQQVADLFCTQHDAASAAGFDTSRRKVAAETLQGERCDKKKCKVFDVIECQ